MSYAGPRTAWNHTNRTSGAFRTLHNTTFEGTQNAKVNEKPIHANMVMQFPQGSFTSSVYVWE
jgi:hypothetical protein